MAPRRIGGRLGAEPGHEGLEILRFHYRELVVVEGGSAAGDCLAKRFHSRSTSVNHDLRISHVAIDRKQFRGGQRLLVALPALRRAAGRGQIGSLLGSGCARPE